MTPIERAAQLLDLGAMIPAEQAQAQLEGAVALHTMLERFGVAYLADEVGMGKTFVALATMALFRHAHPGFRVLIIAPRENIQRKWQRELVGFTQGNVRSVDMNLRGLDHKPVRSSVHCNSLMDLVHAASTQPDRDFFARLTSFSVPMRGNDGDLDGSDARRLRKAMLRRLPWLDADALSLRNKREFKHALACAACCALPQFDLVIVDEAHNLKHGLRQQGAERNRLLSLVLGCDPDVDRRLFPGYGPRAKHVLLMSATPIEDSYRHVWNQLAVVGKALTPRFDATPLIADHATDAEREATLRSIMVRRVRHTVVAGQPHSKNQYRREWREGGVDRHDEPIEIRGIRDRLSVALVQRKVCELLGSPKFSRRFQAGMLASFESFAQTARVASTGGQASESTFDGAEQTDQADEREGIDVPVVNQLALHHERTFGESLPHPKMDALVDHLDGCWERGDKALVFVRRVASVKELRQRLNARHDRWLASWLRSSLPQATHTALDQVLKRYAQHGTRESLFQWFCTGDNETRAFSPASLSQHLGDAKNELSIVFERNLVAELLGSRPSDTAAALAHQLGRSVERTLEQLAHDAAQHLPDLDKARLFHQFEAVQRAALIALATHDKELATRATALLRLIPIRCASRSRDQPLSNAKRLIEMPTLFTALLERPELRSRIWPVPMTGEAAEVTDRRATILAAAARSGHALLDLYAVAVELRGSIAPGSPGVEGPALVTAYLDRLEHAMHARDHAWCAFHELAALSEQHERIMRANLPDLADDDPDQINRELTVLMGGQEPVSAMRAGVNMTAVRQFRMPGYPMVLFTTDVLQEGEDLHLFCSRVYHYGIAWTPSALEQRIGRVDRVGSKTERRLGRVTTLPLAGDDMLQVFYPYLQDSIEVVQNDRVFSRLELFHDLMHHGLGVESSDEQRVDLAAGLLAGRRRSRIGMHRLESRFGVDRAHLEAARIAPPPNDRAVELQERLAAICRALSERGWHVEDQDPRDGRALVEATLASGRRQPCSLLLHAIEGRLALRCVSPIGRVEPGPEAARIRTRLHAEVGHLAAIAEARVESYDLTAEASVLLPTGAHHDLDRALALLQRVLHAADRAELILLDADRPLSAFREQLSEEGAHE